MEVHEYVRTAEQVGCNFDAKGDSEGGPDLGNILALYARVRESPMRSSF
jgi:hypothetical protein